MKRVFLYAYDKINLGDDLFIRTIVSRYPDVQFYIWTDPENQTTFRDLSNLKVMDKSGCVVRLLGKLRDSFPGRYRCWLEKRCDASVYIGGSIFMEYPNWEQYVDWWKYKAENYRFFALGANFGPYKTEDYRDKLCCVFDNMQDICFRDRYSFEQFRGCEKVRYAPDILFSYPMPNAALNHKQIFVSVIDCAGRDEIHNLSNYDILYVEQMASILKEYLADGCTLVLASFCHAEGDERAIEKITDAMGCVADPRIQCLAYDGTNAETIITAISESEYVIASRFHAMVLAMVAGRPVLPVVYSDKTLHVLEDLDFRGTVFDLRNGVPWDYQRSRQNWDKHLETLSTEIKKESLRHFEKLDKLLME